MIEFPEQKVDRLIAAAVEAAAGLEGTESNDPDDDGGNTKFGVTEQVARDAGYTGRMADLSLDQAKAIYRKLFVELPAFDKVLAIDPSIGAELVEAGINLGPAAVSVYLQRWLNGFNYQGDRYPLLKTDGRIGPTTLTALQAYLSWRGQLGATALLKGLNCSQGAHYLSRTEAKAANRKFLFGWVNNRVTSL